MSTETTTDAVVAFKDRECAEEDCELKVYCQGWCHKHFLARFAVSSKKPKSEFSF